LGAIMIDSNIQTTPKTNTPFQVSHVIVYCFVRVI
jgi:hypothetical protein